MSSRSERTGQVFRAGDGGMYFVVLGDESRFRFQADEPCWRSMWLDTGGIAYFGETRLDFLERKQLRIT